ATLGKIHPKFEWLGWFQVGVAAVIAVYYVAVIGWAISYFGMSFTQSWGSDTNAFFFSEYLALGDNSPTNLGSIQWKIALAMLIAWG
ncbi:sodium-dependent transporter, partial [Vibrio vulnificus]